MNPDIRPEGPGDAQAIARIRASADFIPELSLVALQGDLSVGHLLISRERLRTPDGQPAEAEVLLLGPVSVLPDHQRQGIGSALIQFALPSCQARPELAVVLVGHPEYYPRFGFRCARDFGLLPDWDAAMVYGLRPELSRHAGLKIPV